MKVSELIEFLNDHDGEAGVYIKQDDSGDERGAVMVEARYYAGGDTPSAEVVLS